MQFSPLQIGNTIFFSINLRNKYAHNKHTYIYQYYVVKNKIGSNIKKAG